MAPSKMSLVTQEQLLEWTGYQSEGYLVSFLEKHHVPYWRGNRGRICTTEEAINKALEGYKPRGTWLRSQDPVVNDIITGKNKKSQKA